MVKNKKKGGVNCNWCGLVVLLLGLYFLAVDLGYLNPPFDALNWWTALFLLLGIGCLKKGKCSMCKV